VGSARCPGMGRTPVLLPPPEPQCPSSVKWGRISAPLTSTGHWEIHTNTASRTLTVETASFCTGPRLAVHDTWRVVGAELSMPAWLCSRGKVTRHL
jgi:hypothetical protein